MQLAKPSISAQYSELTKKDVVKQKMSPGGGAMATLTARYGCSIDASIKSARHPGSHALGTSLPAPGQKSEDAAADKKIVVKDTNQMLTTEDAAALLGLRPATLSNWREDGSVSLAFSKFGRSVRYRYADVIAFADRSRCTSTTAARQLR